MSLVRSYLFQRWADIPEDITLTFAIQHLVFRRQPWVVEVETPHFLVGKSAGHLKRYGGLIERTLSSPYCRKILCWSQASYNAFLSQLDCQRFIDKMEIVPMAVPPKADVKPKEYGSSRPIKLLFLGSMRTLDPLNQFIIKGGREAVQAFLQLRKKYPDMQMVMRSGLPGRLKTQYQSVPNLRIIDTFISHAELEREYLTSDIFLLPSYNTTPHSILDAMSYELAVVSLKSWANAEYVLDGVTGLMVEPSRKVPWELCGSSEFREAIREPQGEVVEQIVEKVTALVENADLRKKLARNGRREAETGRFSIAARNEKLKKIFDEVIPNKRVSG